MQPQDAQAALPDDKKQPPVSDTPSPDVEAVWTYRGYRLKHSDFTTAMVHLYRAEITRANAWRGRLDVTTNWALLATSAAVTVGFAGNDAHHSVILLNLLLVTVIMFIEARRYRYYELWSYRIRLIETDFFAALLAPPFRPRQEWSHNLAQSLLRPHFSITMLEALGRRLRRNYVWIYLILNLAWVAKLALTPSGPTAVIGLIGRARLGIVPGTMVVGAVLLFDVLLILIGLFTLRLRQAVGEIQ